MFSPNFAFFVLLKHLNNILLSVNDHSLVISFFRHLRTALPTEKILQNMA